MTGRKTACCFHRFEDDVYSTNNLNHALDKDIVKVYGIIDERKDLKEKLLKLERHKLILWY
jgi:ribonuclease R